MDALQQCAQNYARLCGYAYDCTIARKGHALLLRFLFSPYEFRHLSGLHHLEHPRLEANSERILKDVLAGKITLATLQEAANWAEQRTAVLSRLEALSQLEQMLDAFSLIFGFSPEKLLSASPPIRTQIVADYLIKFQLPNGTTFFFSVQYQDAYRGCSLFVNDVRDYSARQTKFTLLEKKKIHRETGAETLLYRRETYYPE